jgi:hypothetical protein
MEEYAAQAGRDAGTADASLNGTVQTQKPFNALS